MLEEKNIPVKSIDPDPAQPRKQFEGIEELAKNMAAFGQLVPVILFAVEATQRFVCVDGERRLRAATAAGMTELRAVVLTKRPSAAELLAIQASIALHRSDLKRSEQCGMLVRIQKERRCTVNEVCELLQISQSFGSKLLRIAAAHPDVLAALDAGAIDLERAYIISTEPDPAKQRDLLKSAKALSRDQLRKRVKAGPSADQPKVSGARFAMPGGFEVAVCGPGLTLADAIEVLVETVRLLRKGLQQSLDLKTQASVMKAAVKAPPRSRMEDPNRN
jgi:ParB family chromosome partitioning protein